MPPARQAQAFQFINQPNPTDRVSLDARRKARSHAARSGHARLRRLRTLQYQAEQAELEQAVGTADPHDIIVGGSLLRKECESNQTSSGRSSPERRMVYVPRPTATSVPPGGVRDPFLSYKYAFTPLEDYLFQHCKCPICRSAVLVGPFRLLNPHIPLPAAGD